MDYKILKEKMLKEDKILRELIKTYSILDLEEPYSNEPYNPNIRIKLNELIIRSNELRQQLHNQLTPKDYEYYLYDNDEEDFEEHKKFVCEDIAYAIKDYFNTLKRKQNTKTII